MTKKNYSQAVADVLAKSRIDAGFSQRKMAKLLGVHCSTIQNWENNITEPSMAMVHEWFDVLHLPFLSYYLKDFTDCCNGSRNVLDRIKDTAALYPPEYQEKLLELLLLSNFKDILDLIEHERKVFQNEK